jgi:hypothetical protein
MLSPGFEGYLNTQTVAHEHSAIAPNVVCYFSCVVTQPGNRKIRMEQGLV